MPEVQLCLPVRGYLLKRFDAGVCCWVKVSVLLLQCNCLQANLLVSLFGPTI